MKNDQNMEEILEILDSTNTTEPDSITTHRHHAHEIISKSSSNNLAQTTNDILNQVIKPLFSKSHHPSLTSTGRKNLISQPTLPTPFDIDPIFDTPQWKTSWTIPLLLYTLRAHDQILNLNERKRAFEANFHLLVPALLHLIDDTEIEWKASGCGCLAILCGLLFGVSSEILKRTGLMDVFVEALKHCFHYLPSLTSEEESLRLMTMVYPAWMGLGMARFVGLEGVLEIGAKDGGKNKDRNGNTRTRDDVDVEIITIKSPSTNLRAQPLKLQPQQQPLTPAQITSEHHLRASHYTTLLRHSLLHSLSHLNHPHSTTHSLPTSSLSLTTFFLHQLPPLLHNLSIDASIHLQTIISQLTPILHDPFTSHAPELLSAAIEAIEAVICTCWTRVREKWWGEILRACVACWLNLVDDLEGLDGEQKGREGDLRSLMEKLKRCVAVLADVVGEEFETVVEKLVKEEEGVRRLFTWP